MAITYIGASVTYSRYKREFNIWAVEDIPECLYILEHYPPPLVFLYNIIDLTVADWTISIIPTYFIILLFYSTLLYSLFINCTLSKLILLTYSFLFYSILFFLLTYSTILLYYPTLHYAVLLYHSIPNYSILFSSRLNCSIVIYSNSFFTCISFIKLTASITVTMESIEAMSSRDSPSPVSTK